MHEELAMHQLEAHPTQALARGVSAPALAFTQWCQRYFALDGQTVCMRKLEGTDTGTRLTSSLAEN